MFREKLTEEERRTVFKHIKGLQRGRDNLFVIYAVNKTRSKVLEMQSVRKRQKLLVSKEIRGWRDGGHGVSTSSPNACWTCHQQRQGIDQHRQGQKGEETQLP